MFVVLTCALFMAACASNRSKQVETLSFSSVDEGCMPKGPIPADAIQGPKQLFLPVSLVRAKEIMFDAAAPYGYRVPPVHEIGSSFKAWRRLSDERVKYQQRTDVTLYADLEPVTRSGGEGVNIIAKSEQVGGLATYSSVSHILKRAHCLHASIDLIRPAAGQIGHKGQVVTLDESIVLPLRLTRTVSSRVSRSGDRLEFILLKDIVKDGITVIPRGTRAIGEVIETEESSGFGQGGRIGFKVLSITASNSQPVKLTFTRNTEGEDAVAYGLFGLGVFAVLLHGSDPFIPAGYKLDAKVSGTQSLHY